MVRNKHFFFYKPLHKALRYTSVTPKFMLFSIYLVCERARGTKIVPPHFSTPFQCFCFVYLIWILLINVFLDRENSTGCYNRDASIISFMHAVLLQYEYSLISPLTLFRIGTQPRCNFLYLLFLQLVF